MPPAACRPLLDPIESLQGASVYYTPEHMPGESPFLRDLGVSTSLFAVGMAAVAYIPIPHTVIIIVDKGALPQEASLEHEGQCLLAGGVEITIYIQ